MSWRDNIPDDIVINAKWTLRVVSLLLFLLLIFGMVFAPIIFGTRIGLKLAGVLLAGSLICLILAETRED